MLTRLTPRERDVVFLIAEGLSNKGIAEKLGLVDGTVKVYVSRLIKRLGLKDRPVNARMMISKVCRGVEKMPEHNLGSE